MISHIEIFISNLLYDLLEIGKETHILYNIERRLLPYEEQTAAIEKLGKGILAYKNLRSRQRFVILIHVLNEVHELILTGRHCTYRELFYKNVNLCGGSQLKIKRAINDVCNIFKTTAWNLGVFATGKGFVAGCLKIHMCNGDIVDCSITEGPSLVPPNFTYIDHLETNAEYILLVEKDSIFEKLLSCRIFSATAENLILITGRGYPDIATRWLLHRLWHEHNLPIYMLADADPFGIEIMLIYRYGSYAQTGNGIHIACPQMKWLGLYPSDINRLHLPIETLSVYDYKKTQSLLRRQYISKGVRQELEILKRQRQKAKLDNIPAVFFLLFISDYITNIEKQVVI